jgi:hypothetical protein
VVVENSADAWPLSGLDKASVVYEFLAESRIPRFVALFPYGTELDKIGPVRSARPYFLDILKPLSAIFMHVGGAPDALSRLKTIQEITNIDQFFNDQFFWREETRDAPHDVYTSSELINKMFETKELTTTSDFKGWLYRDKDENREVADEPKTITVNFTNSTYQAKYIWDKMQKLYLRYQAKEPMKLADGSQIWTDNVVVELHKHKIIDSIGRREIEMTGEGLVWIFNEGGEGIKGLWKKTSDSDIARYYDEKGVEIPLVRGKTWVEIIDSESILHIEPETK